MQLAYIDWLTLLESLVGYASRHGIMRVVKRHPRCGEQKVEEALACYKDHPNVLCTDEMVTIALREYHYGGKACVYLQSLFMLHDKITSIFKNRKLICQ